MIHRKSRMMLIIITGLLISGMVLAGCSNSSGGNTTTTATTIQTSTTTTTTSGTVVSTEPEKEVIKLSMLYAISGIEFKKPTLFQTYIMDTFKVDIEYVEVPPNSFEKVEILFATGEYPEFLPMFWDAQQVRTYRREGFLLPLDDYFDMLPNYRARYNDEEWEQMIRMTAYRDKHHWIPVKNFRNTSSSWVYRKDLFESKGLQPPKTPDELYNALMTLKEENKEMIFANRFNTMGTILNLFSLPATNTWLNPVTNVFETVVDSPGIREALAFGKKMYNSGLLALDFPTWTQTQFDNAVAKGNISFVSGYATDPTRFKTLMVETVPNVEWALSPNFVKPDLSKPGIFIKEQPWFAWGMAITDKTPVEKMERIMEMINWFSTREGNDFLWLGPEGVTYEIVDDYYLFKEGYRDPKIESGHQAMHWAPFQEQGFLINAIAYTNYVVFGQSELSFGPAVEKKKSPNAVLWDEIITPQIGNLVYSPFFRMDYTPTEEKNTANWGTAINDIIKKNFLAFIMQSDFDPMKDDDWNKFIAELNAASYQEWVTKLKEVYERSN